MWTEFKNFAFKGNAFELAVGVIMASGFGKIVDSMTQDLIMPLVGLATGGIDFSNMFLQLAGPEGATTLAAAKEAGATLAYGNFITTLINFMALAFVLLQLVKVSNGLKRGEKASAPAVSASEIYLREIRDALAAPKKK